VANYLSNKIKVIGWTLMALSIGVVGLSMLLHYIIPERTPIPGRWNDARASDSGAVGERLRNLGYMEGYQEAGNRYGVTIHSNESGVLLYTSGHGPHAFLMDMNGTVIHNWSVDFYDAFPNGQAKNLFPNEHKQFIRRAVMLDDMSLLAVFDYYGLVKIDKDSNIVWSKQFGFHHDVEVADNGDIYAIVHTYSPVEGFGGPVVEDWVMRLDQNGEELMSLSIIQAFENTEYKRFLLKAVKALAEVELPDPFHTNTIRVVHTPYANGSLLVSMRNIDTIAIINETTGKVVWARDGMEGERRWNKQHEPILLDDDTMLIFDNGVDKKQTSVIEYNFVTDSIEWNYTDSDFYSETIGTAQRLSNGNTMIAESDNGRAFEVTREGEKVWEWVSPYRAGRHDELVATLFFMERVEDGTGY